MITVTDPDLAVDQFVDLPPTCEALLRNGRPSNHGTAVVAVRFKAHGCGRDGKAILLCAECRDWIARGGVQCGYCDGELPEAELFIVSSVSLT